MRYKQSVRFQEKDYDGRGCLYFPYRCGSGPAAVLRHRRLNLTCDASQGRTLSRLPAVQRVTTPFGVHGHSGPLHLLGGGRSRRSHRRLHHRILSGGFRDRAGRAGIGLVHGYRAHHAQTA